MRRLAAAERFGYVDWRRRRGVVDLIQLVPWSSRSNPSAAKSHSQFCTSWCGNGVIGSAWRRLAKSFQRISHSTA